MKWLEIIELRSVDRNWELLKSTLKNLIYDVEKETKNQTIKTYSRVVVDNDFRIHLFHESNEVEHGGSKLGLNIVSILKEFGLVNHSVWIEFN